jgi:hypothetical protein
LGPSYILSSIADLPTGPKEPKSTVLSIEDEAIIVAFRRHTLLPLDHCLCALQPTIPRLLSLEVALHECVRLVRRRSAHDVLLPIKSARHSPSTNTAYDHVA